MESKGTIYSRFIKRPMDFVLSIIAIIILSPLLLLIALLIRINLGSPIIFKQERPGLNEKIFTMYKFRTMTDEKDKDGNLLPNEKRHTKFGKFLRATSLDELPELFNVINGDMSLVGPRPLLVEYLPLYNDEQAKRHLVRPGITGKAQVNGRNAISWEEKFQKDIYYVNHVTFSLDIKLLILTIYKVVTKENINQDITITMEKFKGSN